MPYSDKWLCPICKSQIQYNVIRIKDTDLYLTTFECQNKCYPLQLLQPVEADGLSIFRALIKYILKLKRS